MNERVYFTYLDLMRHMRPCDLSKDKDGKSIDFIKENYFSVFGSFDAIRIKMVDALGDLKKEYEEGHELISWESERQPMFLASLMDPSILFTMERDMHFPDLSSYPLMLTVIQLEKKELEDVVFEQLLEAGTQLLNECLNGTGAIGCCFFNLGQSDLTLIIRCPVLKNASDAIVHFWNKGIRVSRRTDEDIPVYKKLTLKSSSSHCAFRIEDRERMQCNIREWIRREAEQENPISFRRDFEFTDEFSDIIQDNNSRILLGDYDLTKEHLSLDDPDKAAEEIADLLIYHSLYQESDKKKRYTTSSTVPVLKMDRHLKIKSVQGNRSFWKRSYEALDGIFAKVVFNIKECGTEWEDFNYLCDRIQAVERTLQGMYKYLHRLGVACFEYDLEAYTGPIFEHITEIARDLVEKLKSETETDNYRKHNYVREFVDNTVSLITELQHLYSVLSLSPNTFMETYGSSMRSLNAASAILTAYQGILHYLNRMFPSAYFELNNENKLEKRKASHAILLLPYRMTQSSSLLMYQSFSPRYKISLFHVDFTKMFDMHATLFMLGHESGHMLTDQLREKRFKYFVDAAVRQYVEQNVLGWYFSNPIEVFFEMYDQNEAGVRRVDDASKLPHGMNSKDWQMVKEKEGQELEDSLEKLLDWHVGTNTSGDERNNAITKKFREEYEKKRLDNTNSQYRSYHMNEVVEMLSLFIEENYEPYGSGSKKIEELAEMLLEIHQKLSLHVADFVSNRRYTCNPRYFNKLVAYYHVNHRRDVLCERMLRNVKMPARELLYKMADTFRDIHADVFMCKLLDTKCEEYTSLIKDFSGHNVENTFRNPQNLIRFDVILETCFEKKLSIDVFAKEFGLSIDLANACTENLCQLKRSTGYKNYLLFARECCSSMDLYIQDRKNDRQINAIRRMYQNRAEDEMTADVMDAVLCMYTEVFAKESRESECMNQ